MYLGQRSNIYIYIIIHSFHSKFVSMASSVAFWVVEDHQLGDGLQPVKAYLEAGNLRFPMIKPVLKNGQIMSKSIPAVLFFTPSDLWI